MGTKSLQSTQQLRITLSIEMAELVRAKVESGDYANESEVVSEGLRMLQSHHDAVDQWRTFGC